MIAYVLIVGVLLSQFVTRDKVIGMQVVDQRGVIVGTVKDIAFTVGREKIGLVVETKDKKEAHVQWTDVAAVGDLVLLRTHMPVAPPTLTIPSMAPPSTTSKVCPRCGFENLPIANFCRKCGAKLT
jgi:sporulation protein YlmC with PRC-barrel domain